MWEKRKYVLLSAEEAEGIDYSNVLITSADTLPWNQAKTTCYVKYDGSKPSFLSGKTALTRSQMMVELAKTEWVGDLELPEE